MVVFTAATDQTGGMTLVALYWAWAAGTAVSYTNLTLPTNREV